MTTLRILYHIMCADLWERVRRYSFLVVLGLTAALGYTFVPPATANYVTVTMGDYRGIYNSAWIGGMMALMTQAFLPLPGFYLIKNTLERDRRTGVGQIIATTPLSKWQYALGKVLSNFAVMATIVAVLIGVAAGMQLIRGEEMRLNIGALVSPFLWITLPSMAVLSALAVLFETIGWLRGSFGNVVYFFVWFILLGLPGFVPGVLDDTHVKPFNDIYGITIPLSSMHQSAQAAFPGYNGPIRLGYEIYDEGETITLQTFRWDGIEWTPTVVMGRLIWVVFAGGLTMLASLLFNRFDPSREKPSRLKRVQQATEEGSETEPTQSIQAVSPVVAHLTPVSPGFRFMAVVWAELRLLLQGQPWWWYGIAAGLIVLPLFSSTQDAQQWLLPLAWVWPVLIWSQLGCREALHSTQQLIFSSPHSLARQLPATWLAGWLVTALSGAGVAIRLLMAGDGTGLLIWGSLALFIPSLALALGVWSRSSKTFEVSYLFLWYLYISNTSPVAIGYSFVLSLTALGLLLISFTGRAYQIAKGLHS